MKKRMPKRISGLTRILTLALVITLALNLILCLTEPADANQVPPQKDQDAQTLNALVITPALQLDLAQSLEKQGAFSSAAHEYVRFYHLFPHHDAQWEAQYRAGDCFFKAGMYQDALRLLNTAVWADPAPKAFFKLAQVHAALKDPGRSALTLNNLLTLSHDASVRDRAHFILAWLLMDNAHAFQTKGSQDPIDRAKAHILEMTPQGRRDYKMDPTLVRDLDRIQNLDQKDPKLAGLSALIPGGGFLYTGRYRDALVSFLLNTSLMVASAQAFDKDQAFLGGFLAFVEAGFYSGNIYGSITGAHKYNRNQRAREIKKLKSRHAAMGMKIQPRIGPSQAGVFLSWSF